MDLSGLTLSPYWVGIATLAGLLSFLSPCVLALVPAYIGYLGGRSVSPSGEVIANRWTTFSHGVAFVFGFSVVFVLLGAAASAIGTMGVITIPFLNYDTRRQVQPNPGLGYFSSALMGVFFAAGWAPCVGPVLGAVLTLAISSARIMEGVILLINTATSSVTSRLSPVLSWSLWACYCSLVSSSS